MLACNARSSAPTDGIVVVQLRHLNVKNDRATKALRDNRSQLSMVKQPAHL